MNLVTSILAISIAIVLYFSLIEFFSALFRITGLTREKARFQVISMITCVGFTTGEAEVITLNRRRRRLAVICMICGNLFNVLIISLIINLISNINPEKVDFNSLNWIVVIVGSLLLILIICKLPFVSRFLEKLLEKIGRRIIARHDNDNVLTILDSYDSDAIVEIYINKMPEILENKTLMESNFKAQYNINIMMLERGNRTIEITKDTVIQKKDRIVVFGNKQTVKDLFTYKVNEQHEEVVIKPKENIITLIDNYGSDAMAEVEIAILPEILKDKKLFESQIKTEYNLNVLTLKRNDESIKVTKDTIIEENDVIVIFGNYSSIKKVFLEVNKN